MSNHWPARLLTTKVSRLRTSSNRWWSIKSANGSKPVLQIPSASIFPFSASDASKPVLNINWTIHEGENWAIIGDAGGAKQALLQTLLGQTRIKPSPPKGLWPLLLDENLDPFEHVRSVSFAHRPRAVMAGGFYDYSARYGAVREEDKVTLRQYLSESVEAEEDVQDRVVQMAENLELTQHLDLHLVALSNGQTRRARIVKALLRKPKVLLLDEPLTGLDSHHRPRLISLLHALHKTASPRIIMSLRMQDPVPDWISHIALVRPGGQVVTGPKEFVLPSIVNHVTEHPSKTKIATSLGKTSDNVRKSDGAILVDLQGINVSYHGRHVLKNLTWTIREGERWLLRGPNGSGKTTLLSMITGDHPQSYTQNHLWLFGAPRRRVATPDIARRVGISSPELFNAFPRRSGPQGLTVRDAIGTGFEGVFTYRKPTAEQAARVDSLLDAVGPAAWSDGCGRATTAEFGKRLFADLTPGEQALVLLLRALVNEPRLLILDEAFSGMDERMVEVVTKYLREYIGERQSIIWVSHWDVEAPWGAWEGVMKYTLEHGHGSQLIV